MAATVRIPLVHADVPDSVTYALSEAQARILRKAGWVDAPPAEATDEAEQGDPLGALTTAEPEADNLPDEAEVDEEAITPPNPED